MEIELPLLIADVGSSSGKWVFWQAGQPPVSFDTPGFSPVYSTPDKLDEIIGKVDPAILDTTRTVHYFGTGCFHENPRLVVEGVLRQRFTGVNIHVGSDLEGAALALYGLTAGWVAILGTGSSLAQWSGSTLKLCYPGTASSVKDPGSGTHIGSMLLRALYSSRLPPDTRLALERSYPEIRSLPAFESDPAPAQAIAQYAQWVILNAEKDFYLSTLLMEAFSSFVADYLGNNIRDKEQPVAFNGSIAWHGRKWLEQALSLSGFRLGKVIESPIIGLTEFYKDYFHEKGH